MTPGADRPVIWSPCGAGGSRSPSTRETKAGHPTKKGARQSYQRRSPVETTHVQLPTGDRLLIPTGTEALRLKGYLIMCRNSPRDYT